jgi:hypothetical protein
MQPDRRRPRPLSTRDIAVLGTFFEPSQCGSWHSLDDLRAKLYG